MLEKMKKEKGVDWNEMPDNYKYGTFVKVNMNVTQQKNSF